MIWQQNQDLASPDQSYLKNDSASLVCLANSAEDMFPWVPFKVGLIKNLIWPYNTYCPKVASLLIQALKCR